MSSRNYTKHLVANTAPADLQIGDEYYDPGNNKLFKRVAYNGTTVQDIQISTGASVIASTSTSASGGSGTSTAIVAEKQRLRDITTQVDSATTTAELRAMKVTV